MCLDLHFYNVHRLIYMHIKIALFAYCLQYIYTTSLDDAAAVTPSFFFRGINRVWNGKKYIRKEYDRATQMFEKHT